MSTSMLIAFVLAFPVLALGETATTKTSQKPLAYNDLINLAVSVAPEFGADFLLSTVEKSIPIGGPKVQQRVIEYAFELAAVAQEPIARRALAGSAVDSRSGYFASAYRLDLDKLSLQVRALELMLSRKPAKALTLASEMRLPSLTPISCSEPLVYDVGAVYKELGALAQRAFTADELRKEKHLDLIRPYLTLTSPSQIAPALDLLASLDLGSAQFGEMLALVAAGIADMPVDVRTSDYVSLESQRAIQALVAISTQRRISPAGLLAAYRQYLTRNLQAPRCADAYATSVKQKLPAVAIFFNDRLIGAVSGELTPISPDEAKPATMKEVADVHSFWQSDSSRPILEALKRFRFGNGRTPTSAEQKQSADWQDDFLKVLNRIVDWKPGKGENAMDFYQEKAAALEGMVDLAPPGRLRQTALESFCTFVRFNWAPTQRLQWFFPISRMLKKIGARNGTESAQMWATFADSGDPVLYVYTYLSRLQKP